MGAHTEIPGVQHVVPLRAGVGVYFKERVTASRCHVGRPRQDRNSCRWFDMLYHESDVVRDI